MISRRDLLKVLGASPSLAPSNPKIENEDLLTRVSNLQKDRDKLADVLREYSRSQNRLWQKLPYLILQRGGHFNSYGSRKGEWAVIVYEFGLLSIQDKIFVDLENGELLDLSNPNVKADAGLILTLSRDDLDAQAWIEYFKEYPLPCDPMSDQGREYRNESCLKIAKECNLSPDTFKRVANLRDYLKHVYAHQYKRT